MIKKFLVTVNGESFEVEVEEVGGESVTRTEVAKPAPRPVVKPQAQPKPQARPKPKPRNVAPAGSGSVEAPISGTIVDVKVNAGDSVEAGDLLLVLEAMKMENEIFAPVSGTVKSIEVSKGQKVDAGDILAVIE